MRPLPSMFLVSMPSNSLISATTMFIFFFFNDTATTEIYTLSLHDALPIYWFAWFHAVAKCRYQVEQEHTNRSEEHTSELQSPCNLVCRLLLEKKKNRTPAFRLI